MSSFKSADDLYKRLLEKYTSELNSGDTIRKKQAYRKELEQLNKSMIEDDLKEMYSLHLNHFRWRLDDDCRNVIDVKIGVVTGVFLDINTFMMEGGIAVTSIEYPDQEFKKIASFLNYQFDKNEPFDPFHVKAGFEFWKNYFTELYVKTFKIAAIEHSLSDLREIDTLFTDVTEPDSVADKHYTIPEMKKWVDEMWKEVRPKYDSANKAKFEAHRRMKEKFGADARAPDTIVSWACKYNK